MMNVDPTPYRWQDHVIPPHRTAANLMATGLVAVVVGAGLVFAHAGAANSRPPAHAAITERTPPLCQLARRPGQPPTHAKPNLM